MNYRLQHNVRGSVGGWEASPGAFQQSKQKRTIYLLQNRTVLFVANSWADSTRERGCGGGPRIGMTVCFGQKAYAPFGTKSGCSSAQASRSRV